MTWLNQVHVGDCRRLMRQMAAAGVQVQCVVTSPPYWGLRDYGVAGQFGLERTWIRHVARMRHVFRLTRALLSPTGTLWMNYGDSYHSQKVSGGDPRATSTINGKGTQQAFKDAQRGRGGSAKQRSNAGTVMSGPNRRRQVGLKPKDLIGMPWRVAFALQADGWYLRSDIVWHKPNPMPESITDRPTKAHEYLFLLAKSERYHYDAAAIAEPVTGNAHARKSTGVGFGHGGVNPKARTTRPVSGWASEGTKSAIVHNQPKKQDAGAQIKCDRLSGFNARWKSKQNESFSAAITGLVETRNTRTVWTIPTEATSFAHFATFPRELVRRAVLAGSKPGDTIFDPFMGSGTVAEVALSLGRQFIGCELNPAYAAMFKSHRSQQTGLNL